MQRAGQRSVPGRARPEPLARGLFRLRADPPGQPGHLRRQVPGLRLRPAELLRQLRPGRGDPVRQRQPPWPGHRRAGAGRRSLCRQPCGTWQGQCADELWLPAARACRAHCRTTAPAGAGRQPGGRDLGRRPEHRPGLLAQPRGQRPHLRRDGRPDLAAYRRPGLHARRGSVRHRAPEGHADRARAEPVPAGPGKDPRARSGCAAQRPGGSVRRRAARRGGHWRGGGNQPQRAEGNQAPGADQDPAPGDRRRLPPGPGRGPAAEPGCAAQDLQRQAAAFGLPPAHGRWQPGLLRPLP
ncbi:hypothetical protein D3C81_1373620 [compost metagenome]